MILIALGILVITVILEDVQEVNASHGWLTDRWWYAKNRWRVTYKNPEGPYGWWDRKWWSKIGFAAFVDLWHLAKTLRVWIFCFLLVSFAGLSLWWLPVTWGAYGFLHDHVVYGRLRQGRPGALSERAR